ERAGSRPAAAWPAGWGQAWPRSARRCPLSARTRAGCLVGSGELETGQTRQIILCLSRDGRGPRVLLEGARELGGDPARQPETEEPVVMRGTSALLENLSRADIDHAHCDLAAAQFPAARGQAVKGALVGGLHERGHRQVELALGKGQLGLPPRIILELDRRRRDAGYQVLRPFGHRERFEPVGDLARADVCEAMVLVQLLAARDRSGLRSAAGATGDHEREQAGTDHERSSRQPDGAATGRDHWRGSISLSTTHLWLVIIIPSASKSTMYTVSSMALSMVASAPSMPAMCSAVMTTSLPSASGASPVLSSSSWTAHSWSVTGSPPSVGVKLTESVVVSKAPVIVAVAPSMPSMWSAVSVTSVPTGNSGSSAGIIPSGAGPPSI